MTPTAVTWALPGRSPELTPQSSGRSEQPGVGVFASSSLTHCEPNGLSASSHGWVPKALASLPGTKHTLRREEGRGGACGDTRVTWSGGSHLKVLPSGLMEGMCTDTFLGHSAHERGSGQGGGDLQTGRQVTRRGSRLRFSAPRVSSPGPGAGPHSAGWRSRGRRRTGGAGRPRSPPKSARSRHLRGPRGHWVGLDWPWPLGPCPLHPAVLAVGCPGERVTTGLRVKLSAEVSEFSGTMSILPGAHRAHLWLCPSSSWGGDHTEGGQTGQAEGTRGRGGQRGLRTHAEAKHLGPSAWTLGLDLGGRLRPTQMGGRGLL